jgi:hypothetical protein
VQAGLAGHRPRRQTTGPAGRGALNVGPNLRDRDNRVDPSALARVAHGVATRRDAQEQMTAAQPLEQGAPQEPIDYLAAFLRVFHDVGQQFIESVAAGLDDASAVPIAVTPWSTGRSRRKSVCSSSGGSVSWGNRDRKAWTCSAVICSWSASWKGARSASRPTGVARSSSDGVLAPDPSLRAGRADPTEIEAGDVGLSEEPGMQHQVAHGRIDVAMHPAERGAELGVELAQRRACVPGVVQQQPPRRLGQRERAPQPVIDSDPSVSHRTIPRAGSTGRCRWPTGIDAR